MPSFGLSEALKSAVEASRAAKVMRPAEAELAARAADKNFAVKGAVPPADLAPAPMDIQAPEPGKPNMGTPAPDVADAAGGVDAVAATPEQAGDAALAAPVQHGVPDAAGEAVGAAPEPKSPQLKADEAGFTPPKDENPATAKIAPESVATPDPVEIPPPSDIEVAAARLSKANLGDFALDESHQPNFDTMTTTDDVKAVIAQVAEDNKAKIDVARRGKISNEQLTGLAQDLDVSTSVVRQVMTRESGGVLNPETILAARQVLNASATRLQALAAKVTGGTATDMEKLQFARQAQFHNDYQTQFMGARAEAGRSLNAFSIPTGTDPHTLARMHEILNGGGADINRLAAAINMATTPAGIGKLVQGGLFSRTTQASMNFINRVFVNGVLSGPTTFVVNTTGNALFQAMNAGELAIAARIGRFLPGDEHVVAGEALATLAGSLGGVSDAFRLAWRALKTGQTLDNVLRYETPGAKPGGITGFLPGLDKPLLGAVIRGTETVIDIPGRVIGANDELFKTLAYRGWSTRMAFLHVQEQLDAGALKLEDAGQSARDFMENLPPEAQADGEAWAHQMTFQNPLGDVGQKFTKAIRSVPALTLITPFMRTAVNIFKESAARSPVALLTPRFWAAMEKGGAERDLAVTRFLVGSGTAALVAHYAASDVLTGSGPQNPQARALWEADGRRPYSIKVTNPVSNKVQWYSYARMEPIASVIGATADATEIASYIHADDDVDTMSDAETQHLQATGAIIAGIMNNTGNKTFMKGISDFVELLNDPGRNIQHYAQTMAASMVPFSGADKFVRNTQDPYMRQAWTTMDAIRNELPGFSEGLPLSRDIYGDFRLGKAQSILGNMSPISESDQKNDRVTKELVDVMNKTRLVPVNMPDKRQGGIDGVGGMRLNAREYSLLTKISRQEPVFGNGNTFKEQLQATIDSGAYKDATPMQRADLLRKVQTAADRIGVAQLEEQDPGYAERIAAWRMKANRLKFDQ